MAKVCTIYLICSLLLLCSNCQYAVANKKKTNWNESYIKSNKQPYGTYLLYQSMQQLFPNAKITATNKMFKNENSFYEELPDSAQLKFMIAHDLDFSDAEINKLLNFISDGNYVFIAAENIDMYLLEKFGLHCINEQNDATIFTAVDGHKYMNVQTFYLGFEEDSDKYDFSKALPITSILEDIEVPEDDAQPTIIDEPSSDDRIDKNLFDIWDLGTTAKQNLNFIMIRYGKGRLLLHSAPLLFTNYCMLQKNNKAYVEKALTEYLPASITQIQWHQYLYRRRSDEETKPKSVLDSLMKYPMWMVAIMLAAVGLLLYVLFNGKRRQREVPIIDPLANTSIEFAETIGQLYFNKQDHKNIAEKMIAHFLEKIRNEFALNTNKLHEQFVIQLSQKSGASHSQTTQLVDSITTIKNSSDISVDQLTGLYKSIQQFKQYFKK